MNLNLTDTFFDSLKRITSLPVKIGSCVSEVKWFFQRIYRRNHTADVDLWGLFGHLAKIIYPKLLAF
jgi:hypothetical protein